MTYRIIMQPRAEHDIQAAAYWIVEQSRSPSTALRWVQRVRSKIATLKANPQRCPVDADSDAYGREVRVLLYGKRKGAYRILFTIEHNAVHILTVRHSARRSLSEEFNEED
jgi:plasmid stabilization system protein ParE